MNIAKVIALTCKLNIINTLFTRKNIINVQKFKNQMIFKIIFEENKKILELNNC